MPPRSLKLLQPTARAQVFPEHVLYARPNPDRSRKQCANCVLWAPDAQECQIHDANVIATADSVCGYHVFGMPSKTQLERLNIDPVPPELSGLEQVPGGTSCDRCRFYQSQGSMSGLCQFLDDPEEPGAHPVVEALSCCARWAPAG